MESNLITWKPENILTVFLMFLVGWAVVSLLIRFIKMRRGTVAPASGAPGATSPTIGG